MGQLAFRRLAGSEIDIRTLGKMVLLGAILGCAISLIRIYPLVSGPIANASSSNAVISGTAVITSDPIISESKGDLDWVNQEVLRITLRLESAKIRNQVFDVHAPVLVFTSQPEIVTALKTAVPGQTISITGKLYFLPKLII